MKKLLLAAVLFSLALPAFAMRSYHPFNHRHSAPPPPIVNPVQTPLSTSPNPIVNPPSIGLQIGAFQANIGTWKMVFTDLTFPSASGNLVIFIEPRVTYSQISSGSQDSALTAFASAAAAHAGQIIVPINEEVNCDNTDPWGGSYPGNTPAGGIAAFQHIVNIIRPIAPAVRFAYSVNNDSCSGGDSITAYYPGPSYVDIVGIDGFDFGGQTWDQVFDHAIVPMQQYGKPIWILSEGSIAADNQAKFIADSITGAKTYGIAGIMYFNGNQFVAPLPTLQSL